MGVPVRAGSGYRGIMRLWDLGMVTKANEHSHMGPDLNRGQLLRDFFRATKAGEKYVALREAHRG